MEPDYKNIVRRVWEICYPDFELIDDRHGQVSQERYKKIAKIIYQEFGLDVMDNGSYKDIAYVSKEITYLASQLGSDKLKLKQVLNTKEEEN